MNKRKFFKGLKKYLIIIFIALISCTFLSSCKPKKGNNPPHKEPEKVTISSSTDSVTVDMKGTFMMEAQLTNNSKGTVVWESEDEGIATIDATGIITPVSVGITNVIASYSEDKLVNTKIKVYITDDASRLYPIEFDLNGGNYDGIIPSTYSTFTGIPVLPTPAKENNEFVGWLNSNGELVTKITNKDRGVIQLVAKYNHYPTNIYIKAVNEDLWVGKTYDLSVAAKNELGGYKFSSSNESVARVNEKGQLTCVGIGDATITAIALQNENTTAKINIHVYGTPSGFKLSKDITSIRLGANTTLSVSALENDAYAGVTWSSLNNEIAEIDKYGVVKTKTSGEVTFRATSIANKSIYSDFTITVNPAATSVRIITPSTTSVNIGESINLTAKVFPETVSQDITWQVNNPNIATISETGKLEILERGEVTIFAISSFTAGILDRITITGTHPLLNEEKSDVKYILCAPGTDASTMISINYHAMSTKTFIEYTTSDDENFENAVKYEPTGRYFEETDPILAAPFPARNIFSAEITGLTPNTNYIYRINGGDGTLSETYHFKTASSTGDNFSFVWLSDNHYNTIYEGAETSEQTIQKAIEMRGEISFVFDTGDMIDTGGNADIWTKMFEQRKTLQTLPLVSTTGNHELYVNGTGQWDNRFHAAYNALPKNGVEGQIGTGCYFIYNDVLFVAIENVSRKGYEKQLAWMEELFRSVREENKAKMIIVGMHAPIQDTNKADRDETMTALFDKYGVELVLTGHYHTHQVKRNYYEGSVQSNPLLGVNYMIGNSAGAKGAGEDADLGEFAKGYIVDIIENSIKVTQINANGRILNEYQFDSICYEEVTDAAKQASIDDIVKSLTYTVDSTLGTVTFNWSHLAYGNVKKIKFNEIYRGQANMEVYILNQEYQRKTITNVFNGYDSKFNVEFYFNDGTVKTVEIPIVLSKELNLSAEIKGTNVKLSFDEIDSSLLYTIKYLEVYVDGELIDRAPYHTITNPLTSYTIENMEITKETTFEIRFINKQGETLVARSVTLNK